MGRAAAVSWKGLAGKGRVWADWRQSWRAGKHDYHPASKAIPAPPRGATRGKQGQPAVAGRPIEINRGKRVNVYLDAESLAIAERGGNVSQAIRDALKRQDNRSSPP